MNKSDKMCPIHHIRMARLFELAYHKEGKVAVTKQINVRYHCRVCRAKEEFNKIRGIIPKRM